MLRFALYAGAVLLAAGVAIAWLVNNEIAGRAQRTVEGQARAVVGQSLRSHLRTSDFERQASGPRLAALDRLFRASVLLPGVVVGGRLIGPDGTVTYAARHALIGSLAWSRSEQEQVLDGTPTRSVTQMATGRSGGRTLKVLRVTVPVRLQGRSRAIGAIEIDQDYRAIAVGVGNAQSRLALILALALLTLYISLFPILRRVTRQLADDNRRLHDHAEERGRLLAAEQSARGDAEAAQQLLADQNARLLELDGLKDEFISLVSHELRTPLTSIRGYVELLRDEEGLDDDQRRFLAVVDRNSERLLDLVADLLFLAQVDAGKLALDVGPVDLDRLVAECVENALPTAAAKGVAVASTIDHVPSVDGDRARLAQVLDNLISNGLKFTPAGGRVEVRLGTLDGSAVLEVEDTGIGLAEEELERLFERFFRSSRATENAIPGTGLGLSIAKAIVERHGGRIGLRSALDAGTTVRVELPLVGSGVERRRHELAA